MQLYDCHNFNKATAIRHFANKYSTSQPMTAIKLTGTQVYMKYML